MENNNSKILFVNSTTYTLECYEEFLTFHNKKFNFKYIIYNIFWSFIFLLCIYISFSSDNRMQGVLVTIILISFIAYRFIKPKLIVNKELKSDKFTTNNTNTFTFYDNFFEVSNNNGKFNYKYFMLHKIFETENFFYLYVSTENAFLISKNAFSVGTAESFSKFLNNKCKMKFRKCIK